MTSTALDEVADPPRRRSGRRGERAMVPPARPLSYYGRPILKPTPWKPLDIAGYFFLGGLAGASSVLAAGAELTDRPDLARTARVGAAGAISLSLVALVHDLGRRARFVNMLRVLKPTSPMSVGSWLLAGYAPAALLAAACDVSGRYRRTGLLATGGAAVLGPAVASYTAVLIADTAVPAWHDARRHLPFVFVSSAASAAGGLGILGAPVHEAAPARRLAAVGGLVELGLMRRLPSDLGFVGRPYEQGAAGRRLRAAEALTGIGVGLGCVLGRRSRLAAAAGGAALLAGSALTRFGIFQAGLESASDPAYVVQPQKARRDARV